MRKLVRYFMRTLLNAMYDDSIIQLDRNFTSMHPVLLHTAHRHTQLSWTTRQTPQCMKQFNLANLSLYSSPRMKLSRLASLYWVEEFPLTRYCLSPAQLEGPRAVAAGACNHDLWRLHVRLSQAGHQRSNDHASRRNGRPKVSLYLVPTNLVSCRSVLVIISWMLVFSRSSPLVFWRQKGSPQ
jgi:hypothetical protein